MKPPPKYPFAKEETQEELVTRLGVDVVDLKGTYLASTNRKAQVTSLEGKAVTAEEFVAEHYETRGYTVISFESRPWHALFGVLMWLLVQDPGDEHNRIAGFGNRNSFDSGEKGQVIWTLLPDDFGVSGYSDRRADAIRAHLEEMVPDERDELLSVFDYWVEPSEDLRQYLWAHDPEDVRKAHLLVKLLKPAEVHRALFYLIENYWERYLGWPDLLVYKDEDDRFLIEVKSPGDKLSQQQKSWMEGNQLHLQLPFKLVKVHRSRQQIHS